MLLTANVGKHLIVQREDWRTKMKESKSTLVKYTAPQAVRLRDTETGVGDCVSGSVTVCPCRNGGFANGNDCVAGSNVRALMGRNMLGL